MAVSKGPEEKRCPSGIDGLDRIIGGGFPTGGLIHVAGNYGSGKTSMAVEFIIRGAAIGRKGMYISTTQAPQDVLEGIIRLDVFDEKLVKDKTIRIVGIDDLMESLSHATRPIDRNGAMELLSEIEALIEKNKIERMVIDPITPVLSDMEPSAARDFLKKLGEVMHKRRCTSIVTTDIQKGSFISPLPCDGAILLDNVERHGDILRVLQVLKMAGTSHSRSRYVFDITSCGILMTPLLRGGIGP